MAATAETLHCVYNLNDFLKWIPFRFRWKYGSKIVEWNTNDKHYRKLTKKIIKIVSKVTMIVNHAVSFLLFFFIIQKTEKIILYFTLSNWNHLLNWNNYLEDALTPDSSSKKSCQGCELPSHDIPDSTSNSRGHNNNTPSATNNNNSKNLGNGKKPWTNIHVFPCIQLWIKLILIRLIVH